MKIGWLSRAMSPGADLADFLCLFGASFLAIVIVLLGTALFFEIMNARHPARRVQQGRINPHKWRELKYAPGSIFVIAMCFAGGLFAQWQGWALTPVPLSWWSAPLMLGLSVLLYDGWFYWVHRLLHWSPMLRFHALHHRSVSPTIWTNHHETIVEAFLNQFYYLAIVFVFPVAWQILVVQKIYDQITGMLGHAGYEHFASPASRWPWPLSSTVFHDMHHSSFRFNFAHTFSIWDRLLGSLHPDYDITVRGFEGIKTKGP